MQSLQWYVNRARAMSPEELARRAQRQLRFGAERLGVLGNGSPPQAAWPPRGGIGALPTSEGQRDAFHVAAADEIRRGIFPFFGRRFELGIPPQWNRDPATGTDAPLDFGKTLDYRDSRVVGDAKHLWELNRHLELVPLAQAWRLTGDDAYLDVLRQLVTSWIDQCPYLRGPNWCSSLELGIRLVNWQLVYSIAGGAESPLFKGPAGAEFRGKWLRSIYQHTYFIMHHLSTYPSSANNHLIGELAGVFVASCTWPCWPVMETWKAQAREQLQREIERQTHADGVNKEQTTWYQQFVATLFIAAGVAGLRAGCRFDAAYWDRIAKMLEFLSAVMDTGGHVPMIGDADDGLVFALEPRDRLDPFRSLLGIGAALFDDPRWRAQSRGAEVAAEWLCAGLEPVASRADAGAPPTSFPDGGYYVLGRDLGQPDEARLLVDAGPLGFLSIAGHGHADCLSLTLSVAGREQLVDPGTYAYHAGLEWRDYFRGTAAHNTVRVDGIDQSEMGGPFLWLKKAECTVESFDASALRASHTGYLRLPDPVRHTREISFDEAAGVVDVVDHIECRGRHTIERFWHFAESCDVTLSGTAAESTDGAVRLRIEVGRDDGEPATQAVVLRGSEEPIAGWISRRFGHKSPTATLIFTTPISGTVALRTRIRVEAA